MPRTRPADRPDQLAEAAITVFKRKGYRQALMSDVAKEMGVSSGLLYSYVESKEALLHFALEWAATRGDDGSGNGDGPVARPEPALPIPTPAPGETARVVGEVLRRRMAQPALKAALRLPKAL